MFLFSSAYNLNLQAALAHFLIRANLTSTRKLQLVLCWLKRSHTLLLLKNWKSYGLLSSSSSEIN